MQASVVHLFHWQRLHESFRNYVELDFSTYILSIYLFILIIKSKSLYEVADF